MTTLPSKRLPAQIALAWLLPKPVVTAPIIGASKLQHLEQAVAALELRRDEAEFGRLRQAGADYVVTTHAAAADQILRLIR